MNSKNLASIAPTGEATTLALPNELLAAEPAGRPTRATGARTARAVDVLGASLLLVLSSPLLLAGMLLVLLASGRPIFFSQRRVGLHGRPFRCLKLRTMHCDAQARLDRDTALRERFERGGYKLRGDDEPRLTPVGHWLRVSYVDELPQLLNVLAGHMTLVGPRPVTASELAHFKPHVDRLLRVKPGIFGAWTALGLERPRYPRRARIELAGLEDHRVCARLRIVMHCMVAMLAGHPDERLRGQRARRRPTGRRPKPVPAPDFEVQGDNS